MNFRWNSVHCRQGIVDTYVSQLVIANGDSNCWRIKICAWDRGIQVSTVAGRKTLFIQTTGTVSQAGLSSNLLGDSATNAHKIINTNVNLVREFGSVIRVIWRSVTA